MEQEKMTQVTDEVQITSDDVDGENRAPWKGRSKEISNNKDYLAEEKWNNRRQLLHKRKHGRQNGKEEERMITLM